MILFRLVWVPLAFGLVLSGCGGSGGGADSGVDAGADATGDGGPGDKLVADIDLGNDFGILVQPGAQTCTLAHGGDGIEGIQQEYLHGGRIILHPGLTRLPRGVRIVEADFIERVELGPERAVAEPTGAGAFTRTLVGDEQRGTYHYEFQQSFTLDGAPIDVVFETGFEVEDGVADEPVLVMDGDTMAVSPWVRDASNRFELGAKWDDGTIPGYPWTQGYTACESDAFDATEVEVEIGGSETLRLSYRCPEMPTVLYLGSVCSCLLARAVFESDGQERVVIDPFHLVYTSWDHCSARQATLVVLDPPLEGASGLLFWSGVHGVAPAEILFLDQDFGVIDTRAITDWKRM